MLHSAKEKNVCNKFSKHPCCLLKTTSMGAYNCLLDSDQHHAEIFIMYIVSWIPEGEHVIVLEVY